MPETPYARTMKQTINKALRLVGDYRGPKLDGYRWTRTEVAFRANRMLMHLFRMEMLGVTTVGIPVTADARVYDLPEDCLRPLRIAYHGSTTALILMGGSNSSIDIAGNVRDAGGTPAVAYRDLLSARKFALWPVPTVAGNSIDIQGEDEGMIADYADDAGAAAAGDDEGAIAIPAWQPIIISGSSGVLTDVGALVGNLELTFLREPEPWNTGNELQYPDPALPEWFHPWLAYGLALALARPTDKNIDKGRSALTLRMWQTGKGYLNLLTGNSFVRQEVRPQ